VTDEQKAPVRSATPIFDMLLVEFELEWPIEDDVHASRNEWFDVGAPN
jgi:hypothetical protein